jgi:hypothetical protein
VFVPTGTSVMPGSTKPFDLNFVGDVDEDGCVDGSDFGIIEQALERDGQGPPTGATPPFDGWQAADRAFLAFAESTVGRGRDEADPLIWP